jgi:hypothetical protein
VKKYTISGYSAAKNMPEIVEVKLSSCGLKKKLRLWNCRVAVAEQHSFKSCGIAIVDSKKKLHMATSAIGLLFQSANLYKRNFSISKQKL